MRGSGSKGGNSQPIPIPTNLPMTTWTANGQPSTSYGPSVSAGRPAGETTTASTNGTITVDCTWQGNAAQVPDDITLAITSTASVGLPNFLIGTGQLPSGWTHTSDNGFGDGGKLDENSEAWVSTGTHLRVLPTQGQPHVTYSFSPGASGSKETEPNSTVGPRVSVNVSASVTVATYGIAVNAGGNESSQTGTSGNYFDTYFRDSNYGAGDDPNENSGLGVTRYLPPDKKHFYAVVTSTVTLPDSVVPPSSVSAKIRRIRYVNNVAVPASDPQKSITLGLVVQSAHGAPVHHGDNTVTYTYRTHDLEPDEQTPYYIAGTEDLWIDDWMGRWQFSLDNFNTNALLKIDKRDQLVTFAYDWANFWSHRPESSKRYYTTPVPGGGTETSLDEANYRDSSGNVLFTQCHSFVAYIYNKMGLYAGFISDPAGDSLQTSASAIDDYAGAVRCFSGHSGLITALGLLWGGEMVDINNPQEEVGHHGVEIHGWDVGGTPDPIHPNRTMPDPAGAPDPDFTGFTKSFLKVLDVE